MTEARQTITIFPSIRSVDRRRRTVDFVNKMKVLLRKTKPIREDKREGRCKVAGDLGQLVAQRTSGISSIPL